MELKAGDQPVPRRASTRSPCCSWGPDYFDPHTNADTFAHNDDNSDDAKSKPLAWRNNWFIPDITKEMLAAAKELDAKKRAEQYAALQKKVTDDGPVHLHVPEQQPGGAARDGDRASSPASPRI